MKGFCANINFEEVWNKSGIYKITNKVNNKSYVGMSTQLGKRLLRGHIQLLRRNNHENIYLQRAWNKYGEESFIFEILLQEEDVGELQEKEEFFIREYKSHYKENGYNLRLSSYGYSGYSHTDEAKNKITESHQGENNYLSSLNEKEVIEIKRHVLNKTMSVKKMSETYNVKRSVISNIKNGYNWKHVKVDDFVSDNTINRNSPLTDSEVITVKEMLILGVTHKKIANRYDVSESYISKIHRGEIKKEIEVKGFKVSEKQHKKLSEEEVKSIKILLMENELKSKEIANMYDISVQTICDIKKGRRWTKIKI